MLAPTGSSGLARRAGESQPLVQDDQGAWQVHGPAWSPDGKRIAYVRDSDSGDVYVIENYR